MNKLKYAAKRMQTIDIVEVETIANECGLSFWSRADYLRHIERQDGISLVVKDNAGKTIGFLAARLIIKLTKIASVNDLFNKKFNYHQCELEIYNIAVSPPHQFRGAGKLLLSKFLETTRNCDETIIWLEVRRSNVQAVNFYSGNGFKICYTRKNYYSQPVEDALVMKLAINAGAND